MATTSLTRKIADAIAASLYRSAGREAGRGTEERCISFRTYMEMCLYDEDYGYYRTGPIRIGKDGDFYTSSAVGDVLGQVIARYGIAYSGQLQGRKLRLAEWGGGTGRLSAQIAAAAEQLSAVLPGDSPPLLIEDHPAHAAAAKEQFRSAGAKCEPTLLRSSDVWEEPERWLAGPMLLVANELLDAFPVHRVKRIGGELYELGVAWDDGLGLYEVAMALTRPDLESRLDRDGVPLWEGQATEICPAADEWLSRLGTVLEEGRVLLIDYGHEAEEHRAEHRMDGTLMTYWRHRGGGSVLERPGEQDITSHVNFTSIRRAAEDAGFRVAYYGNQLQFLLDYGVLDLLADHDGRDPFGEASRRNRAVRQLLLSDGMSESFKVMILQKDLK